MKYDLRNNEEDFYLNAKVGDEFYTSYMEMANVKFKYYTGLIKVKVTRNEKTKYESSFQDLGFYYSYSVGLDIIESFTKKELGHSLQRHAQYRLSNSGLLFLDILDAIEHHDKEILEYSKDVPTRQRESILKKLINTKKPALPKAAQNAIAWYESLTKQEQKHIEFLKYKYDNI
jgi:hypothetical protein